MGKNLFLEWAFLSSFILFTHWGHVNESPTKCPLSLILPLTCPGQRVLEDSHCCHQGRRRLNREAVHSVQCTSVQLVFPWCLPQAGSSVCSLPSLKCKRHNFPICKQKPRLHMQLIRGNPLEPVGSIHSLMHLWQAPYGGQGDPFLAQKQQDTEIF